MVRRRICCSGGQHSLGLKHGPRRPVEESAAAGSVLGTSRRGVMVSAELIGILSVGVALAAMHLSTRRGTRTELRTDISDVRGELHSIRDGMRGELHGVRDELRGDIRAADDRMRTQEQSTAKVEGLLEGLREAVVVRIGDSEQRCGADRLPGACRAGPGAATSRAEDGPCGCVRARCEPSPVPGPGRAPARSCPPLRRSGPDSTARTRYWRGSARCRA